MVSEMGGLGTRPFGQPLCFVQDVEEPITETKAKKSFQKNLRKKK